MKAQPLQVFLPDTRGVFISRYGIGNLKIGLGVYTYSRNPGDPVSQNGRGTCPGATPECEAICYAKRVKREADIVSQVWTINGDSSVPPIPPDAKLLRLHVGGDFDSMDYIDGWIVRLKQRPDVTCWAYTRSWRCPDLLPALERLRALSNVQLFASMDASTTDAPPAGWRRAWLMRTFDQALASGLPIEDRLMAWAPGVNDLAMTFDNVPAYICPEETGRRANCVACGYCFKGKRNDVVFLEHEGDEA